MDKLVTAAAIAILVLWVTSIVITWFLPERKVDPSIQVAMVAVTTFLFGSTYLTRRK